MMVELSGSGFCVAGTSPIVSAAWQEITASALQGTRLSPKHMASLIPDQHTAGYPWSKAAVQLSIKVF